MFGNGNSNIVSIIIILYARATISIFQLCYDDLSGPESERRNTKWDYVSRTSDEIFPESDVGSCISSSNFFGPFFVFFFFFIKSAESANVVFYSRGVHFVAVVRVRRVPLDCGQLINRTNPRCLNWNSRDSRENTVRTQSSASFRLGRFETVVVLRLFFWYATRSRDRVTTPCSVARAGSRSRPARHNICGRAAIMRKNTISR